MTRSTRLFAALFATTAVALTMLSVVHWQLSRRVAALEVVAARRLVNEAQPEASTVQSLQTAVTAWREAQEGGEGAMTQEEAAELVQVALDDALEATLDDALDRRAEAREEERVQRFVEVAQESLRGELDGLAQDYGLNDDQVAVASDVMVQGLNEGLELRSAVMRGDVSVLDARSEGQLLRTEVADSLTEALGADAYDELGRRLHGEGGWESARGFGGGGGLLRPGR